MSDNEKQVPARRKLLKSLAAGGAAAIAAPSEWTKPAMKAVMLPAHAQTSGVGRTGPGSEVGGGFFGGFSPSNTGGNGAASFSMSVTAHADIACGTQATVTVRAPDGDILGSCSSSGGAGSSLVSFSCSDSGALNAGIGQNDLITFTILWENGCSCSWTHLASNQSGSVFSRDPNCS